MKIESERDLDHLAPMSESEEMRVYKQTCKKKKVGNMKKLANIWRDIWLQWKDYIYFIIQLTQINSNYDWECGKGQYLDTLVQANLPMWSLEHIISCNNRILSKHIQEQKKD